MKAKITRFLFDLWLAVDEQTATDWLNRKLETASLEATI